MTIREELVTIKAANFLVSQGWEIIAVHPPDGQGPFVIPRAATNNPIERASFHPDIVAIRRSQQFGAEVLIVECKPTRGDLDSDLVKLRLLGSSRDALMFVLFRCQSFNNGPQVGVNFEQVSSRSLNELPIRFMLACGGRGTSLKALESIGPFSCELLTVSA